MDERTADRVQISAMVPDDLRRRLQHTAIDTGRTQSEIVTEALERLLGQLQTWN